jgi:hypothetical protein
MQTASYAYRNLESSKIRAHTPDSFNNDPIPRSNSTDAYFKNRLHLQDRRNRFSKPASKEVVSLLAGFLNLFLRPSRWRRYVPPKSRLKLNGLHGVISQKMIRFITTTVKT